MPASFHPLKRALSFNPDRLACDQSACAFKVEIHAPLWRQIPMTSCGISRRGNGSIDFLFSFLYIEQQRFAVWNAGIIEHQ